MLNAMHDLLSHFAGLFTTLDGGELDWILYAALFVALVLAISIHEFGHAWMADKLGDSGPRKAGRLTLSPFAHLDPLGTLVMIASSLIGMPIGWGKPVKTDPDLYTVDRRTGIGLVALAGPAANLLGAITLAIPARILIYVLSEFRFDMWFTLLLAITCLVIVLTIAVSVSLFVFNLLPLYPLDGSHVLASILPQDIATVYSRFMKRYGTYIFLGLLGSGVLSPIIAPVIIKLILLLLGL